MLFTSFFNRMYWHWNVCLLWLIMFPPMKSNKWKNIGKLERTYTCLLFLFFGPSQFLLDTHISPYFSTGKVKYITWHTQLNFILEIAPNAVQQILLLRTNKLNKSRRLLLDMKMRERKLIPNHHSIHFSTAISGLPLSIS